MTSCRDRPLTVDCYPKARCSCILHAGILMYMALKGVAMSELPSIYIRIIKLLGAFGVFAVFLVSEASQSSDQRLPQEGTLHSESQSDMIPLRTPP